jgi:hypothetical protein
MGHHRKHQQSDQHDNPILHQNLPAANRRILAVAMKPV